MTDGIDDGLDFFEVMAVADLPLSEPYQVSCMGAHFKPRRTILGFRVGRPCCWYHGRDWTAVCEAAIGVLGQATEAGIVKAADVYKYAREHVRASGLGVQDRRALDELLCPGIALMVGPSGEHYTNGQHRGQAMKDLGVERTVVLRWPPLDDEETEA